MEKRTKGAWVIHHGKKLQATLSQDFDAIGFAGKSGTLLSAISAVVEVTPVSGGMYTMRLLKPDVGRLALSVIQQGDITAAGVDTLPSAQVTEYVGPEGKHTDLLRVEWSR